MRTRIFILGIDILRKYSLESPKRKSRQNEFFFTVKYYVVKYVFQEDLYDEY